jgi:Sec-independent protein secretion pathway component TatC
MLESAIHNLLNGDLNSVGLVLGFVGVLLVFFFGLPSIGVLSEGSYVEIQVTRKMSIYNWLSRIGLLLIAAGFACQFAAVPIS